jgi:hypothetical protein
MGLTDSKLDQVRLYQITISLFNSLGCTAAKYAGRKALSRIGNNPQRKYKLSQKFKNENKH